MAALGFKDGFTNKYKFFQALACQFALSFQKKNMQRSRPLSLLKRHLLQKQNARAFSRSFTSMNGLEQGILEKGL
jgi:hypothetical protein